MHSTSPPFLILRNTENRINPLNSDINPIYHLLAFVVAHHILHVSKVRVKVQNFLDNSSFDVVLCVPNNRILRVPSTVNYGTHQNMNCNTVAVS